MLDQNLMEQLLLGNPAFVGKLFVLRRDKHRADGRAIRVPSATSALNPAQLMEIQLANGAYARRREATMAAKSSTAAAQSVGENLEHVLSHRSEELCVRYEDFSYNRRVPEAEDSLERRHHIDTAITNGANRKTFARLIGTRFFPPSRCFFS